MKKIEAVIVPSRLGNVRAELERRGIHARLTLTEVHHGDGQGVNGRCEDGGCGSAAVEKKGTELQKRLKIELIVGDRLAQKAVSIILQSARIGSAESVGHITLLPVDEALQIVPPLPLA